MTDFSFIDSELSLDASMSQAILQSIDALVVVLDPEGRIRLFNRACQKLTQYSFEEVFERRVWDFLLPPHEVEGVRDVFGQLRAGDFPMSYHNKWIAKDGNEIDISWSNTAITDSIGQVEFIVGTGIDITDQLQAESGLRETKDRFQALVESTNDWIWELDTDANFLYASPRVKEILGYEPEELIGKSGYFLMPPSEGNRISEKFDAYVDKEEPFHHLININLTKDGRRVVLESSGRPFYDNEGKLLGYRGSDRDITDRKNLEEQLRHSEKMQAIGRLAGGISHDFNNQIGGILGMAELIKRRIDDPDLMRFVDSIIASAERSADLTSQMLAFARKGQFQVLPVDIHETIQSVTSILNHSIDKRILIEHSLTAPAHTTMGDPTQLQNALLNLAINARDAMPDGGILSFNTSCVDIDADLCNRHNTSIEPGRYLEIEVKDTGAGMSPEVANRMFEPFFTTKGPGEGTGMGLAAVYGTIEAHKGMILADSEIDHGTSIKIFLPPTNDHPQPTEKCEPTPVEACARILMVEDEEIMRESVSESLLEMGYAVECNENGKDAVERYSEDQDFDLILLDMVMPVMNGTETFHALRELNPDAKIVIISGYALDDDTQALLDSGAIAFLEKPFTTARLMDQIKQFLN